MLALYKEALHLCDREYSPVGQSEKRWHPQDTSEISFAGEYDKSKAVSQLDFIFKTELGKEFFTKYFEELYGDHYIKFHEAKFKGDFRLWNFNLP